MNILYSKKYLSICLILLVCFLSDVNAQQETNYNNKFVFVNMERKGVDSSQKNLGYKMAERLDKKFKKKKYSSLLHEGDTLVYGLYAYNPQQHLIRHGSLDTKSEFSEIQIQYSNMNPYESFDDFPMIINKAVEKHEKAILDATDDVYLRFFITKKDNQVKSDVYIDCFESVSFPNGYIGLKNYIIHNMKYPEAAFNNRLSGKCIFSADVDIEGNLSNIKLEKGFDSECDEEAMRLVNAMPKWEPLKISDESFDSHITFKVDLNYHYARIPLSYKELKDIEDVFNSSLNIGNSFSDNNSRDHVDLLIVKEGDKLKVSNIDYSITTNNQLEHTPITPEIQDFFVNALIKASPKLYHIWEKEFSDAEALSLSMDISNIGFRLRDVTKSSKYSDNNPTDNIRQLVKVDPEYPGGLMGLMTYLGENIKYPAISKSRGKQGRVFLNFIVETDGAVTGIMVLKGVDPYIDNEAMRVVANMKNWKPGTNDGKAVRVSFNLPIKFTLQ